MTAQSFNELTPIAQEALWEIARTVLDMNARDQYLAKVSTGQIAAHLALPMNHNDHIPGAFLILAACKFANVIEIETAKESAND